MPAHIGPQLLPQREPDPWLAFSACLDPDVDPDIFHPQSTKQSAYRAARAVCAVCPVVQECLERVLRLEKGHPRYGVWGGLDPRERAALAKQRSTPPPVV